MRRLAIAADVVWTFVSGAIAACLFATFWLFVLLAVSNFPLGLILGRFPHWLLMTDAIVACVVYAIAALVGMALAPIARVLFGGR